MKEVKRVKAEALFEVVKDILGKGASACITVTGMSMYPFLREDIDRVELSRTSFPEIQRGDIVLITRDNGPYVLHRVLRKEKDFFYMVGDAQREVEGPLRPDQLVAVVTAVWRKDREIRCTNVIWRGLSALWLLLLPFRGILAVFLFIAYTISE